MVFLSKKRDAINIGVSPLIITSQPPDEHHSSYTLVCELVLPAKDYLNFEGDIKQLREKIEADKKATESRTTQYRSALERLDGIKTL